MKKYTDLELSEEDMTAMGEAAVRAAAAHIRDLPKAPRSDLERALDIASSLKEPVPEEGMEFSALLETFMNKVVPHSINTPHPAYMAYIPGGGLYPSALADFLAAATNRYTGVWFASPAAARLEANVLEWFAGWMGYPDTARGILTSGGSLANFSAVVTARKHILGDDIARGTVYASDQIHHCVLKASSLAGIPEKNVRILPSDERYRADPVRIEEAVRADAASGLKPFLLVGSAGTTNTGAVDPLSDLAELSRRHGMWFHVDGAYGGFFNLCEAGRKKLSGLELSDSLVLDPHKGLFLPYGSGSLLVKSGDLLKKAHTVTADYMQDLSTPEGEYDPSHYSPELSRSFRALRVWLPLKFYGARAFRENLAEKLELTEWLLERLQRERSIEVMAPADLSVVAFRWRPRRGDVDAFNKKLLSAIIKSRKLFLSSTLLKNRFVIRICILSFRTHRPEVEEAVDIIRSLAGALESGTTS